MNRWHYTVEYKGRFATILTTAGPVGAFRQVTGQQPKEWKENGHNKWLVNGYPVTKL